MLKNNFAFELCVSLSDSSLTAEVIPIRPLPRRYELWYYWVNDVFLLKKKV